MSFPAFRRISSAESSLPLTEISFSLFKASVFPALSWLGEACVVTESERLADLAVPREMSTLTARLALFSDFAGSILFLSCSIRLFKFFFPKSVAIPLLVTLSKSVCVSFRSLDAASMVFLLSRYLDTAPYIFLPASTPYRADSRLSSAPAAFCNGVTIDSAVLTKAPPRATVSPLFLYSWLSVEV